ncbi:MAG: hypothetical protein IPM04_19550 [Saprospiraceae bacterium]|nr:hypothetical protein [Candidatus Brachybacter algidus]MBK8749932.1 hypothetical protein [Candidatus Brachybacter algidus]
MKDVDIDRVISTYDAMLNPDLIISYGFASGTKRLKGSPKGERSAEAKTHWMAGSRGYRRVMMKENADF